MKKLWIIIELWLARHSKKLDLYFAKKFRQKMDRIIKEYVDNVDLDTKDIRIVKKLN